MCPAKEKTNFTVALQLFKIQYLIFLTHKIKKKIKLRDTVNAFEHFSCAQGHLCFLHLMLSQQLNSTDTLMLPSQTTRSYLKSLLLAAFHMVFYEVPTILQAA